MNGSQTIKNLNLGTVMNERFSRYAKSIIQQRAIPDDRDGLKPVQRRILYAMYKDGNTVNKAYRKSAKAVGNVMGNFHPHGDSSIYEALINMSQDWKMRIPLIDLHGNNGSIDDDPPAAMRYTEARLSRASNEMMRDIKKDTVSWVLNFDDTEYEPTILPSRFPNLIVNGAKGISSGYATEIPPHNLGEVINALIYLQSHPHATLDNLMRFIKGPDFPTGGVMQGIKGLKHAYATGRGRVVIRARYRIQSLKNGKRAINVTQIPYGVNKKWLVHQITRIALDHKVNGIEEVRDDSDRHGLSIVVVLGRRTDANGILDYLYKCTDLQIFYHFNVVAIDQMQPKLMSLKSLLDSYLDFQRQIVLNRTKYDLKKITAKQELVKGYIKALSLINQIVQLVQTSNGKTDASVRLVKHLSFTKRQANAIVSLRLYHLSRISSAALKAENQLLNWNAHLCRAIIHSHSMLDTVLRKELLQIKRIYATPRKTSIQEHVQRLHISKRVTVPDEDVMVMVSHDGYLKRSSLRSYSASHRSSNGLRPGDYAIFVQHLNTRDHLLIFTNYGRVIYRPVNEIREARWKDTGVNLTQSIQMKSNEQIVQCFGYRDAKHYGNFLIETNDGYAKQTSLEKLLPGRTYRHHAPNYLRLKDRHSRVIQVLYLPPHPHDLTVLLLTKEGYGIRFKASEIPVSGTNAIGVHSINLRQGDQVIGMHFTMVFSKVMTIDHEGEATVISAGKAPLSKRNRRGKQIIPSASKVPEIVKMVTMDAFTLNQTVSIFTQFKREQDVTPLTLTENQVTPVVEISQLGHPVDMLLKR